MTFWQFLYNNKTKITGALLVAFGALQAMSEQIRAILSPQAFAGFTIGVGVFVAVLGFLNSNTPKDPS